MHAAGAAPGDGTRDALSHATASMDPSSWHIHWRSHVPTPSRSTAPLTLSEAAAYLNVTPRFMRRLVAERRIAFHKVGALLRFRVEDLDAFFESGRVELIAPSRLGWRSA